MPLTEIAVDDGPHTMDGLLLHACDGSEKVEAFISRRVRALRRSENSPSCPIQRTR
jgi:hypothetical protein